MHFPKPSDSTPISGLLDLSQRTAWVTGAAQGIGLGIARRLHQAGARVVLADVNRETATKAAAGFDRPNDVAVVAGDVSRVPDVEAMVRTAVERFGRLDIFVNNAGIFPMSPFLQTDLETARRTVEVNLMGMFICSQAAARQMVAQGTGGRIIAISSVESVNPTVEGLAHYSASKAGVTCMIKTLALELAPHGITINSVAPGGVRTPGLGALDENMLAAVEAQVPMKRMGIPEDIARVVLFLASDLCSHMTGTQLIVDGGRTLRGAAAAG
jgi:2-deoxy-D-gluconate 3-dehydrogenase